MSGKIQIGTVSILKDRKYENVMVPAGTYPVYLDDGRIYWQMEGYACKWEGETTFERIKYWLFMIQPPRGDVITGTAPEIVRSGNFSVKGFEEFIRTDVLCCRGPERRLVFEFLAYPEGVDGPWPNELAELARRFVEACGIADRTDGSAKGESR